MNIYVILSSTNTKMGWLIRNVLDFEYNHVSLYIPVLGKMLSFGRKAYELALVGGFVEESFRQMMYPKNSLKVRIFEIPLDHMQTDRLMVALNQFYEEREVYLYNLLAPMHILFRRKVDIDKAYTCVTFLVEILNSIGLKDFAIEKEVGSITPKDIDKALHSYWAKDTVLFANGNEVLEGSEYFRKYGMRSRVTETLSYIISLEKRYS